MSWSAYTCGLAADIGGRIDALEPNYPGIPEREAQIAAAKTAAHALIESGAVGTAPAFGVTLSGHANAGHAQVSGYAADTLAVNVAQATEEQVNQFDANQAAAVAAAQ